MSQNTGSHKNSLNVLGEKYLNESHWPMRRIRLLECSLAEEATSQSKPCALIRATFDFSKRTGCALIRACALIRSNCYSFTIFRFVTC